MLQIDRVNRLSNKYSPVLMLQILGSINKLLLVYQTLVVLACKKMNELNKSLRLY